MSGDPFPVPGPGRPGDPARRRQIQRRRRLDATKGTSLIKSWRCPVCHSVPVQVLDAAPMVLYLKEEQEEGAVVHVGGVASIAAVDVVGRAIPRGEEPVVAVATDEAIVAGAARQGIVAGVAVELIVAQAAAEVVVAGAAEDEGPAVGAG